MFGAAAANSFRGKRPAPQSPVCSGYVGVALVPLFGSDDDQADRQQELSMQAVAAGGLPLEATRRLDAVADARRTPEFCFTSDLSVNEFLMLRRHKVRPIT